MRQRITLDLPDGIELEQVELEILRSGVTQLVEEAATFRRGDRSGSTSLALASRFGKLAGARVLKDAEVPGARRQAP